MAVTGDPVVKPDYRPGRSAEAVIAQYGLTHAVKLSSNEMPYPALPAVEAVLATAHGSTHRYPDTEAVKLRGLLADRHRTTVDAVAVSNGSVSMLDQLMGAFCGPDRSVAYGWPSFEAYRMFTRRRDVPERVAPLRGTSIDLAGLAAAVTSDTRLVFVCSPNNPTGGTVDHLEFVEFLQRVPHALVVLDEAYAEFVTDPNAVRGDNLFGRFDNLALLRTFSKAYSLAGLRVGYLVAPPQVAEAVRRSAAPFSVNAIAQDAAAAALTDGATVAERCRSIVAERDRVHREFRHLGLEVPPSEGNFAWLGLGEATAAVAKALERRGVVARAYPPHGLRVTVSTSADNTFFVEQLAALVRVRPEWFAALLPGGPADR